MQPSEHLLGYFKNCDKDVGPSIKTRVWQMVEKVFGSTGAEGAAMAQQGSDKGQRAVLVSSFFTFICT